MKRTPKLVALFFVLATSAIAAPHASAFKLTYSPALTATQVGTDVLTTNAGTVSCSEIAYSGLISPSGETPELTPVFEGCSAFGFVNVPIDVNGCMYKFHASTETTTDAYSGPMDLVCSTGQIVITSPGCTVTISSQNKLGSVNSQDTTSASPRDIDVEWNIEKALTYTVDSGCSTAKAGTYSNGSWTGKVTLWAEEGGLWID